MKFLSKKIDTHSTASIMLQNMANLFGVKKFHVTRDNDDIPIENNGLFWTLSYKELENSIILVAGISNKKIGVDIEHILKRSSELLNIFDNKEYVLIGGRNWNSFYILWTAKEVIIKLIDGTLFDMQHVRCVSFKDDVVTLNCFSKIYAVSIYYKTINSSKFVIAVSEREREQRLRAHLGGASAI